MQIMRVTLESRLHEQDYGNNKICFSTNNGHPCVYCTPTDDPEEERMIEIEYIRAIEDSSERLRVVGLMKSGDNYIPVTMTGNFPDSRRTDIIPPGEFSSEDFITGDMGDPRARR